MWGAEGGGNLHYEVQQRSMELWMHENRILVLPVNILKVRYTGLLGCTDVCIEYAAQCVGEANTLNLYKDTQLGALFLFTHKQSSALIAIIVSW